MPASTTWVATDGGGSTAQSEDEAVEGKGLALVISPIAQPSPMVIFYHLLFFL